MSVLTDELSTVTDLSEGGTQDIDEFAGSSDSTAPVFEFRIPLVSDDERDISLEQGRLQFAFAAFGSESSVPDDLQGAEVHFFRVYTLRMTEDPGQIHELFEGRAPPGPALTIATIAIVSLGVIGLLWRLIGGRGGGKA
jgi:hypothetical protein